MKHNVCRQAYHGKSFVGNHVHKCCQVNQIFTYMQRLPIKEYYGISISMLMSDLDFVSHRQVKVIKDLSSVPSEVIGSAKSEDIAIASVTKLQ